MITKTKTMNEWTGLSVARHIEKIRIESNSMRSTDPRYSIIWSGLENGNDSAWEITRGEGCEKWLADRAIKVAPHSSADDMIELVKAYVSFSSICSNVANGNDFNASERDLQWLRRRGFRG
jgi:hypothetical protein